MHRSEGLARRQAGFVSMVAQLAKQLDQQLARFLVAELGLVMERRHHDHARRAQRAGGSADNPLADSRSARPVRVARAPARVPPEGRRHARCTRVTVTVHHPVPAIRLPFIGGYGHGFDVVASQSEVVDPYRSGLPGEATC